MLDASREDRELVADIRKQLDELFLVVRRLLSGLSVRVFDRVDLLLCVQSLFAFRVVMHALALGVSGVAILVSSLSLLSFLRLCGLRLCDHAFRSVCLRVFERVCVCVRW